MSGFYEVTAASGAAAAGDESASWHDLANTLASHPAASRTITATSDAARSPFSTRPKGSLRNDRPTALQEPASATTLHSTLVLPRRSRSSLRHALRRYGRCG